MVQLATLIVNNFAFVLLQTGYPLNAKLGEFWPLLWHPELGVPTTPNIIWPQKVSYNHPFTHYILQFHGYHIVELCKLLVMRWVGDNVIFAIVLKTAKMFQFGPRKRPRRGAVERGDVRKSLLYFSLKDAMPYFSPAATTATERITGWWCRGRLQQL